MTKQKLRVAGVVGVLAIAVIATARAVPDAKKPPATPVRGGAAPSFSERDAVSGRSLTNAALRGRNVLLFFSEGVMCQACFVQIQSLQARAAQLKARGLTLVTVSTDSAAMLRQAASQYGITTALVSDENGDMSTAYGAIGRGMHANSDGHSFILLDRTGRIRWRRDYTTMYVPPDKLLAAIPKVS